MEIRSTGIGLGFAMLNGSSLLSCCLRILLNPSTAIIIMLVQVTPIAIEAIRM